MDPSNLDISLKNLRYLLKVSETDTLSEAADLLDISQPALTQAMVSLEKSVGVQIFEKQGQKRMLTEGGKQVLAFAVETQGRSMELQASLADLVKGSAGSLRVGMTDSANLYLLPEALSRFQKEFPNIEMHVFVDGSSSLFNMVRHFELDLAFLTYNPAWQEGFNAEILTEEHLYLYAPKNLNHKDSDCPWALYPPGSETRRLIDIGLAAQKISPQTFLESPNPQVLNQMIRLGFACSVLPQAVAAEELKSLRSSKIATRRLAAVWRKGAPNNSKTKELIELAKAVLS